MALPGATSAISLGDVNVELALTRTTTIHLGATGVRTLYNVPTGAIRLAADGWGKANRVPLNYVFSANATQTTITMSSIVGYNAGKSDLTITVNPNVIVSSTSTAAPAIAITGAAAGDTITLVNNGYIFGMGGAGGTGGGYNTGGPGTVGAAGGPAITLTALTGIPFYVQNNGVIAGGSGGGGGGGGAEGFYWYWGTYYVLSAGSGGGGGIINGPAGTRGTGTFSYSGFSTAGGGTPPAYTAGTAGVTFFVSSVGKKGGVGGNGGILGAAGFPGANGTGSGGYNGPGAVGGLAGRAVTLNSAVYTATPTASALSGVVIGAGGTFTCAATTLRFGQKVTVTGTNTGTGSITGYVTGTVYYITVTNGSTTFTLSTLWNGTAVATTAGTPIGLTFTKDGTTAGAIA